MLGNMVDIMVGQRISVMKKSGNSKKGVRKNTWLLPRLNLTPDQRKAVEMPPDKHLLVLGPAGSGKTQLLIHRASYLADTYEVSSDSYRLFVYNDIVREHARRGVKHLGLYEETVTTVDHWCRLLYGKHISKDLPRTYVNLRIDFPVIRSEVLHLLEREKELQNQLEFVLVDDGHDLGPEVYRILKLVARHITVFADFQQKIVENGTSESFISKTLGLGERKNTLSGAYRNTPYVANLASYFIVDEGLRKKYLGQIATEPKVKEQPLCYISPSVDKEMDLLAETVKMRWSMNERIGIIVCTNKLLHELAEGLKERGVEVEKAIEMDAQNVLHMPYDFGNDVPKIMTYHTAKSLMFDSIFMPRLTENSFVGTQSEARQRMLFTGIVRARKWVYLSTVRGIELKEISILKAAKTDGHLLMI
jgi:superfamily I DNA/RNA helicase